MTDNMSVEDVLGILNCTYDKLEYVHNDVLVGLVNDLANKAKETSEPRIKSAIDVAHNEVYELASLCSSVMSIVEDEGGKLSWLCERGDETDAETSDKGKAPSDSTSADSGDSKDCIAVTTKQLDEYDAAIDKLSFLAIVLGNLQPVGGDRADAGLYFVLTDAISVFEDMAPKLEGLPRVPSTEV